MAHRSDGTLLREVEEWMTAKTSLLYIRMAFGLILSMQTVYMLGGKFGLIKKVGEDLLFNARELDTTINRCYFPNIPHGYETVQDLRIKYPYVKEEVIQGWIQDRKVSTRRIEIGTEDVLYVDEGGFNRMYRALLANRKLDQKFGKVRNGLRRSDGRGKKHRRIGRKEKDKSYSNPIYKRDAEARERDEERRHLDQLGL